MKQPKSQMCMITQMKSMDIIRRLESEGWTLVRIKGSHHQFKLSGKGLVTVKHPDSDIPAGRCVTFIGKQDGNGDSMKFVLTLHTDDGVKYGVTVPDLPGCFSAGDTLDEAIEMAREAIDLHCEGLYEEEAGIPAPRPLSEHKTNPDLADAVWAIVEVDVEKYLSKPVRLNISLPEGLVRSIDEYARAHHLTRSGFLAKAAQDAMKS